MTDASFVTGDTRPDLTATLFNTVTGNPQDLTDCTVAFQMRKADDKRYTVNAAADIDADPTTGKVVYSWGANDLAVPGDYIAQFEITFVDLRVQTTNPVNTVTVRRQ
jgi:hypothetical protein